MRVEERVVEREMGRKVCDGKANSLFKHFVLGFGVGLVFCQKG